MSTQHPATPALAAVSRALDAEAITEHEAWQRIRVIIRTYGLVG